MDPFTIMAIASVASGALAAGGGLMQNSANREQAEMANKWSLWGQREQQAFAREMAARQEEFQIASAQKAMDFSERMSSTSYQRGMADMRAAGLNPILAYGQGGATAPQGVSSAGATGSSSAMRGQAARMENVLGPAANSAMAAASAVSNIQATQQQIEQSRAHTALIGDQQLQTRAQTALSNAQAITEAERAGLVSAQRARTLLEPALVQAQTGQASATALAQGASARNLDANTDRTRQDIRFQANYGRPSWVGDNMGGVEQMVRRLREWVTGGTSAAPQPGGFNVYAPRP